QLAQRLGILVHPPGEGRNRFGCGRPILEGADLTHGLQEQAGLGIQRGRLRRVGLRGGGRGSWRRSGRRRLRGKRESSEGRVKARGGLLLLGRAHFGTLGRSSGWGGKER